MAYFSQEMKQQLAPLINKLCKEYGVKASISVKHHMNLTVTIRSGSIDFLIDGDNYKQVNQYYINDSFSGEAAEFLTKLVKIMNSLNHDNSDIMTDYFDVGYYISVYIGEWNKPYVLTEPAYA